VHPAGDAVREWAGLLGDPGAFLFKACYRRTSCHFGTRVLSRHLFQNAVIVMMCLGYAVGGSATGSRRGEGEGRPVGGPSDAAGHPPGNRGCHRECGADGPRCTRPGNPAGGRRCKAACGAPGRPACGAGHSPGHACCAGTRFKTCTPDLVLHKEFIGAFPCHGPPCSGVP
jgi:hypothetical protein